MQRLIESTRQHATLDPSPSTAPDARLPYEPPAIAVYGSVADLTGAVGSRGKKDGRRNRRTGF